MTQEPSSYNCACGRAHEFASYVYAHWDQLVTHSCPCGARNKVRRGKLIIQGKARAKDVQSHDIGGTSNA